MFHIISYILRVLVKLLFRANPNARMNYPSTFAGHFNCQMSTT